MFGSWLTWFWSVQMPINPSEPQVTIIYSIKCQSWPSPVLGLCAGWPWVLSDRTDAGWHAGLSWKWFVRSLSGSPWRSPSESQGSWDLSGEATHLFLGFHPSWWVLSTTTSEWSFVLQAVEVWDVFLICVMGTVVPIFETFWSGEWEYTAGSRTAFSTQQTSNNICLLLFHYVSSVGICTKHVWWNLCQAPWDLMLMRVWTLPCSSGCSLLAVGMRRINW